ncbi:hypothetical protein BJY04DRAFT_182184 [Aspergillus karnatakaensis]|uniref:uncharacterized protein n=1 Tax=Aspergillus karnatakaensis TaxID=1810916 RepID=UPI003CCE2305
MKSLIIGKLRSGITDERDGIVDFKLEKAENLDEMNTPSESQPDRRETVKEKWMRENCLCCTCYHYPENKTLESETSNFSHHWWIVPQSITLRLESNRNC